MVPVNPCPPRPPFSFFAASPMVVAMFNSIGANFCSISSNSALRALKAWVSASRRNKTSRNSWCWRKMSRVDSNRSNIVRNSSSVTGFGAAGCCGPEWFSRGGFFPHRASPILRG